MTLLTSESDTVELKSSKIIQLNGLGTCGYLWGYETDANGIVDITQIYPKVDRPNELAPGTSINEFFELRAVGVGVVNITFKQRRPWVDEEPHAEHVATITVI